LRNLRLQHLEPAFAIPVKSGPAARNSILLQINTISPSTSDTHTKNSCPNIVLLFTQEDCRQPKEVMCRSTWCSVSFILSIFGSRRNDPGGSMNVPQFDQNAADHTAQRKTPLFSKRPEWVTEVAVLLRKVSILLYQHSSLNIPRLVKKSVILIQLHSSYPFTFRVCTGWNIDSRHKMNCPIERSIKKGMGRKEFRAIITEEFETQTRAKSPISVRSRSTFSFGLYASELNHIATCLGSSSTLRPNAIDG